MIRVTANLIVLFTLLITDIISVTAESTDLNRGTGRECNVDRDCQQNAYCHQGKQCLCNNRFIAINTSKKTFICVQEASLIGDQCHYDMQCTAAFGAHAECSGSNETILVTGKCQCKTGYHYRDGICYKNSRIGELCEVNDNCIITTSNLVAYCMERRCICPPYYHANNDGTDCLPSSDLNGPCKSDDDCITMNSRCMGVCQCKMGYAISENKKHCLIAADRLNAPCAEDVQCSMFLRGSICDPISQRCNCSHDFHEINGACYRTARLLEPCNQKEECFIDSGEQSRVQCYKKFCLCADNYENVNKSDCVPMKRSLSGNKSSLLQSSLMLLLSAYLIIS